MIHLLTFFIFQAEKDTQILLFVVYKKTIFWQNCIDLFISHQYNLHTIFINSKEVIVK